MTLFEKLKDIITLGYTVKFSTFAFQYEITVEKEYVDGRIIKRTSALPFQDHFYEMIIIDCIEWSINEINKEEKTRSKNSKPLK